MVVLAVRSGAAGAARYFKPEGRKSTTRADRRALSKVCFKDTNRLYHGNIVFISFMWTAVSGYIGMIQHTQAYASPERVVVLPLYFIPELHRATYLPHPTVTPIRMSPPPPPLIFFSQAIQAHAGPLMDALLSTAPDEENAQAIEEILNRCEEQHKGAGATLALGYMDTVWWLPAPIRPECGALAILAVYEALRRFGVFTR